MNPSFLSANEFDLAPKGLTQKLAELLLARNWKIALAESCTGGLLAATLTELAGSSAWFERAYITYSNQAKTDCLEVPADLIAQYGAVSEAVAQAMAKGVTLKSKADFAISITGIAGPSGGSIEKPVGTVCFGIHYQQKNLGYTQYFAGDRDAIRKQACLFALQESIKQLS
jgi:nicotinamide-nucleotide amidase